MAIHADVFGPDVSVQFTAAGNPANCIIDFGWEAQGGILQGEKCPQGWYPTIGTDAPSIGAGLVLTPSGVDISHWVGLTVSFSCDIATWPMSSVDCSLNVETNYEASVQMNSYYEGVSMVAQVGVPVPDAPGSASHFFPGPVAYLPPVELTLLYNLLFISGNAHVLYIPASIIEDTFVPAPTVPPDPPRPTPALVEIGPC